MWVLFLVVCKMLLSVPTLRLFLLLSQLVEVVVAAAVDAAVTDDVAQNVRKISIKSAKIIFHRCMDL